MSISILCIVLVASSSTTNSSSPSVARAGRSPRGGSVGMRVKCGRSYDDSIGRHKDDLEEQETTGSRMVLVQAVRTRRYRESRMVCLRKAADRENRGRLVSHLKSPWAVGWPDSHPTRAEGVMMFYKTAVVLTALFWIPALGLGAICGSIVAGFLGGYYSMLSDPEKTKGQSR